MVLALALRRPPVVAALSPVLRAPLKGHDVAFLAWFGPVGVAAIYYAAFAWRELDDPTAWHVASAVVAGSILAHGASSSTLTRLYARREGRDQR